MQVESKHGRVFDLPSTQEEAEIRAGIADDPAAYELPDETLETLRPVSRPKVAVTKQPVSIRLSPEVVEYFKSTGKGWQTQMDAVLMAYVNSRR
ncbi:BrnA antitoxin family protein [Candidatus Thiosymbion oneisti]|uniref:BrnA antitoxin family protein n=1 Tax=Candidatus Thiosymbion oneisti TaxID=589554 RepID=UPI000A65971B|nr:BrnA antitoxin family protein [Candidatus Thiosymbion oneisti]